MASLTTKIINGRPYLYLRETARVDGRSKVVKTTYLGKPEDVARRLSEGPGEPKAVEVRSFGAPAAAFSLCRALQVAEAVQAAAPAGADSESVGELIELAAINKAVSPGSKRQLWDWFARTALVRLSSKTQRSLSLQPFWDAAGDLPDEAIARAEQEIAGRALARYELRPDALIYDTAGLAGLVDSDDAAGTRGGRSPDPRPVGLALCVALDGTIPLCHVPYEGRRKDGREFPHAASLIRERLRALGVGGESVTLVCDERNSPKENQALADELGLPIVGSLSPARQQELLRVPRRKLRPLDGLEGTSAYRVSQKIQGKERAVVITHAHELEQEHTRSFSHALQSARGELHALKLEVERGGHSMDERGCRRRIAEILRRRWLSEVVKVDFALEAKRLSFRTDNGALRRVTARDFGKRIIYTDRSEWSNEQIVRAYRAPSETEEAFRDMTDPVFAPAFRWTDRKLRVHTLYCTLALLVAQLIEREARRAGVELGGTSALRSLADIHETTLLYPPAGGKQGRPRASARLSAMDPLQQELFEALELGQLGPGF